MRKRSLNLINKAVITSAVCFLTIAQVRAETIKVAVIDTGISEELMDAPFLCKTGHIDFTNTSITDNIGHGSHISGIIDQYIKNMPFEKGYSKADLYKTKVDYCQIIIKFFETGIKNTGSNMNKAIKWAIDLKVNVINISGGGSDFDEEEKNLIEEALNNGIKIVVAAGNSGCELNKECTVKTFNSNKTIPLATFYPAMYDPRLYVVGNLDNDMKRAPSSNYGSIVNNWEVGTNVKSFYKDGSVVQVTGTSQSTAKITGKLVRQMIYSSKPR